MLKSLPALRRHYGILIFILGLQVVFSPNLWGQNTSKNSLSASSGMYANVNLKNLNGTENSNSRSNFNSSYNYQNGISGGSQNLKTNSLMGSQVVPYTVSGTFYWTAPCNVTEITVQAWGAGASATNSGGGGGGAYSMRTFTVVPGTTYTIIVGNPANSNSSFDTLVIAEGGKGLNGGKVANSKGTTKFDGGNGVDGSGRGGGGGGSSASSTSVGLNGNNTGNDNGGAGGNAVTPDGGKGGNGGNGKIGFFSVGDPGQAGSTPGGGGGQGGEGSLLSGSNGAGAAGKVIISYDGMATYFTPNINTIAPISRVELNGTFNTSDFVVKSTTKGYENFCTPVFSVIRGTTYAIKVRGNTNDIDLGFFTIPQTSNFSVYVDFNQNGTFETSEGLNIGSLTGTTNNPNLELVNNGFQIPSTAFTGLTKMRIYKSNSTINGPNNSILIGQIEDYVIEIKDQTATITSFMPTSGCIGSVVTIIGTNLGSTTAVRFNGVPAPAFTAVNATTVQATVPVGATVGKISVVTPTNTAISANDFTPLATPTLISVTGGGVFCNSATISGTATAGSTVYFQGTNSNGTSTANPSTAIVNISGTYYFRAYNGSCWSNVMSVAVTIDQLPTAVTVSGATTACGSTTITASGGTGGTIYFQGTTSGGTSTADPATSKNITTSGTYYFRSQSACGWGPEGSITVQVNPLPGAVSVSADALNFCGNSGTELTATGGSGGIIYFQGTTSGGTSVANPYTAPFKVYQSGTYYFRARTALDCWGPESSITVTQSASFVITTQPQNVTTCTGNSASFTVVTTPNTGLTYQWRKGDTDIPGANSATYTIPSVTIANAGDDYNCIITDACGSVVTQYVYLNVSQAASAPTTQPTDIAFITGNTSAIGSFVGTNADGYLVIRTANATPPTAPVNGTNYTPGTTALGGRVESVGSATTFNSTQLAQTTSYWYWVFAFNNNPCGTTPLYNTVNPLSGNIKTGSTISCGTITNLYWAGAGSPMEVTYDDNLNDPLNWSLSPSTYQPSPSAPTPCTNVFIIVRDLWVILPFDISHLRLTGNLSVHDLTLRSEMGIWSYIFPITTNARIDLNGYRLDVYGNANVDVNYEGNTTYIGDFSTPTNGIVNFRANANIGTIELASGTAGFVGKNATKIILDGSITFGKMAGIDYAEVLDISFNGSGQTITWNNSLHPVAFRNVEVGQTLNPSVQFAGTVVPDNITGNIVIKDSAKLDLKALQWNRITNGGTLTMKGTSALILGGNTSVQKTGNATLIAGSNFPSGFTTSMEPATTVEYNGTNTVPQVVYAIPNYGNLVLTRGSTSMGTAPAQKSITGNVSGIQGDLKINANVQFDLNRFTANRTALGGTLSMNNNSFLLLGGTNNFPANFGTKTLGSSSTVNYYADPSITQNIFNDVNYGNLILSNTSGLGLAIKNLGGNITGIQGNLSIQSNSSFKMGAYRANRNVTGGTLTLQQNAELHLAGSTGGKPGSNFPDNFTTNSIQLNSTIEYEGSDQDIFNGIDYPHLVLSGTATKTASPDILNVRGDFRKTSATIFNANSGTVNMKGTTEQKINSVAPNFDFNNVSLSNTSASSGVNFETPSSIGGELSMGNKARVFLNADITLKSNALQTARVNVLPSNIQINYNSGLFVVERYMPVNKKAWHMLAVPTFNNPLNINTIKSSWQEGNNSGQNTKPGYGININGEMNDWLAQGFDAPKATLPSMKYFDVPTQTYMGVPSTLQDINRGDGSGYFIFVRGDRSITASNQLPKPTTLRTRGRIYAPPAGFQPPVINLSSGQWALVGNPYASAIDYDNLTKLNLQNAYYIWDPNGGGEFGTGIFRTISGGVAVPAGGTYSGTVPKIQSGQAFLVQATTSGAGKLTFVENAKSNESTNITYRSAGLLASKAMIKANLYSMSPGNTFLADGVLSRFGSEYSNGYDNWDATKMINDNENLAIRSNGLLLAVEGRQLPQNTDSVQFEMSKLKNQAYHLQLIPENFSSTGASIFLGDRYLNTLEPISSSDTTEIAFTVDNNPLSKSANRFYLVFKGAASLPVQLIELTAVENNQNVNVEWKVTNQQNVKFYEVQRAGNGVDFESIGRVEAQNNNRYQFVDRQVLPGNNYYRIRIMDRDDSYSYSQIVKVIVGNPISSITVNPNPITDGNINLLLKNQEEGDYWIRLFNADGQLLISKKMNHAGGTNSYRINHDYKLAKGIYHLEITKPNKETQTLRVLY